MSQSFAAVLISNPARPAVDERALACVSAALSGAKARVLADGVAAEFEVSRCDPGDVRARLVEALGGAPIDVAVVPVEVRRKRLLIADMDSTMIEQECLDELAGVLGLKAQVSAITERAMNGEIAFEPALRERVALLEGLPAAETVSRVLANRITLMPGAKTLLATMRADGAYAALVSGGFTAFTGAIAATLGFHEHRSNTLLEEAGKLTGKVAEPILGKEAKLAALNDLMASRGLKTAETLAVGDGANDLAMLGAAGLGVAYRAKPAVAQAAHVRIDHGDLTALLFLQGYRSDEFVGG
ncbi:phosphoserine phosphatase SerB [Chenggangzhangella methanolivorans]|uniref:Phosphoserine phosphatase n=1 Tax=Chenggangzhangella methanolivorans TaxID=1437009 RepID=A0A9E6UP03_9HYPH|nr:phosphoserine phosphatase SerB [Chenggangzhangella methanolivorans]QZO00859.1 phosphoserine phosphatase SerB [Chenggangzhangella methanolivorans]